MYFIDTHIHLYADEFEHNRQNLIDDAVNSGINTFIIPNIDSTTIPGLFKICNQMPNQCFPMMGLHPCNVKEDFESELNIIKNYLDTSLSQVVAVGEIGIDLYWDQSTRKNQEIAFRQQLQWATSYKLPVAIHSRNSTEVIISILEELRSLKLTGVFHCFSGNRSEAEKIIDMGFLLGIGGVLTFKNSGLDRVIADIPMEYIVLETDAPYLAPVPYRGKTNLPAYLLLVAEKLAQVKNINLDQVAKITSENAKRLFGLN